MEFCRLAHIYKTNHDLNTYRKKIIPIWLRQEPNARKCLCVSERAEFYCVCCDMTSLDETCFGL